MRVGSTAHHMVLGPHTRKPIVLFDGEKRAGKEWTAFEAANTGKEIVTLPEWRDAEPVADAILRNAHVRTLLDGALKEIPMAWQDAGIDCATDGVDIVGRNGGYIADIKTTSCAEPAAFTRHAFKLLYHAQMAWYRRGGRALKWPVTSCYLIAAEVSPPYPVTVMRVTEAALAQGEKSIAKWIEALRRCREEENFPEYTQAILDLDLPPWFGDDAAADEGDDDGDA
jgi:hypothetical protein